MTLIPKGSKDRKLLKNWRPLVLLNTYYKIVSGVLTARLKPALDYLIHADQKAYLQNRYVGEITRSTYDILDHAKHNNLPGLILLLDFAKAFDSIEH